MANRASIKEDSGFRVPGSGKGQDGRATRESGLFLPPALSYPQQVIREHRHLACAAQAGSLFSLSQGGEDGSKGGQKGGFNTRLYVPGPPPTSNLILLAVVHGDPAGYGRAWRFFEQVRPEVVTVEISRFSVRYRERARAGWQRRLSEALKTLPSAAEKSLAVARVAAQADLPFEYRSARDWGMLHQVPVKFLDAGAVARSHLPRYADELLSTDNLRVLWENEPAGTLDEFVAAEFRRAHLAREGKLRPLPRPADPGDNRRERLWAKRLKGLVNGGKRVVHLGGWEHLVPWEGGGGLSRLLADLQPRILLLDEADRM